jgi:hypothetical protein
LDKRQKLFIAGVAEVAKKVKGLNTGDTEVQRGTLATASRLPTLLAAARINANL